MRVLVTGGGGFVGRALIPQLIQSGHNVIATSRRPDTRIPGSTVCQIEGLGPGTDWSRALEGVETVVHLAARVHVMNESSADPLAENRRVNTEGTRKLAMDASRAGVRSFIFLSTIKVNGENSSRHPFCAVDTPAPQDPYAISKLEAEQVLLDISGNVNMRVGIIRPPLVYGPGVGGNFLSLLELANKGWPLPLGGIENQRSLIYVGNLANLILRLIEKPDAEGVFLCRDDANVSTSQLFLRAASALDRNLILLPIPPFFLHIAGKLTGKSDAVSRLTESLAVDDGPTRDDLDWTPPFSMLQGLKETADWFNNRDHQ